MLRRTLPTASAVALAGWALASGADAGPSSAHGPAVAARAAVASAAQAELPDIGSLGLQPVLGAPTASIGLIGASPAEAPGAAWARGRVSVVPANVDGQSIANAEVLLRYTTASGAWQIVPIDDGQGNPLSFNWWGAEVTNDGGVVLVGEEAPGGVQSIVTRDPGGAFVQVKPPPATAPAAGAEPQAIPVVEPGESLYPAASSSEAPLAVALDEAGGHTGALIVPQWASGSSPQSKGSTEPAKEPKAPLGPGVLHYDDSAWTREPVCAHYSASGCTLAGGTLKPLAIAASSPQDAWLLASSAGQLELFQRITPTGGADHSATPVWVPAQFSSGLLSAGGVPAGEAIAVPTGGPALTATSQGVWVDLALGGSTQSGSATLLAAAAPQGSAPEGSDPATVLGTWCYPTSLCPPGTPSLGAVLPSSYDSFAWAGSDSNDPGTRIITGLPNGALLKLQDTQGAFSYEIGGGAGGENAAFDSPQEGWLGGSSPLLHVTTTPNPDRLQSWPVPFRSPLLAIAPQPGSTPGEAGAQALAVGANGEIARYLPGEGWIGEYLYNTNGERQTPNLRGVAWPEPNRAYAVGDNGAMWVWQADSGRWEADPAKPIGFIGQLTAIAFSATNPDRGYAVGKQGTLLSYDKLWTQQNLPPGLAQANFTSVAFAGEEALATYRILSPTATDPSQEVGGLLVEDGAGWQVDPSAQALLGALPAQDTVLSKVAGLPDGGAVAAGPGLVIERDSAAGSWRFANVPLPEAQNISALAAFREGSSVRALVSLDVGDNPNRDIIYEGIDNPPGPALGQYGQLLGPDPLPERGYLLRETAAGWHDEEDQDYPRPDGNDLPGWPDAVLALLVDPSGVEGWAVGGQTGSELILNGGRAAQEAVQTAAAMRYGAGPSPPQSTHAAIATPAGQASFAVGGGAQCASACADFANEQLGPDAWLSGAVARANQIAGLHAFLYTGPRIAAGAGATPGAEEFERELDRYAEVLGGGSLPLYTAASRSDRLAGGSIAPFTEALGAFMPGAHQEQAYYAVSSPGAAGATVRVIVLDYSTGALGSTQETWLKAELESAKQAREPAIVMGNDNLSAPDAPNYAGDAVAVDQILVSGGASAYLFDSPEENVTQTIGSGPEPVHAYGSGTLGYVGPNLTDPQDFLGASGFLIVNVDTAQRDAETNWAPSTVSLIPSIGQLGLEATDGTLLRRSQAGLFQGLARRPLGGEKTVKDSNGDTTSEEPDPYTPIPESCLGSNCSQFIPPAYSFSSSNTSIGNFVEQDPNSTNPLAVLQGPDGKPVADSASGLFCAYNAGATTVTVTTGGFSYSEQVTVQTGSVEQPCGTVPQDNQPAAEPAQTLNPIVPPPPPSPAPGSAPRLSLTPPPPSTSPPPKPHKTRHLPPTPPLVPLPQLAPVPVPLRAALPPPSPQPARPTPPSGTSQVTEPVGVAEQEHKRQGAVDVVHNMAAYDPGGGSMPPWLPVALILIAAAAGSGIRRARPDRGRALAWASARTDPHRRRPRR